MSRRTLGCVLVLAASLVLAPLRLSEGQGPVGHPTARNIAEMKFEPVPGMPACAPGAVLSGDPAKGPSIIIGKLTPGCTVPWHYHTPNEHLMMISGIARVEVKDGEPITLRAGGFALMPSRRVHQFRCTTACALFVHSDAAYDIHYVDAQGNEIPADEALRAVADTPPSAKTK
jgi:quercetin dioxygenase-like cupin family protein